MTATASRIPRVEIGPRSTRSATAHAYAANPAVPGTCARCHLIKGHRLHNPAEVAKADEALSTAAAEERRRLGEVD
ncbi:hypothetical protein [Actinoplanes sp. CA-252034]|uniref:hypothetical protein n=1 Tax=Actinoplanes sp. CA-252034 TaxID=3239906 RepID=UPI003D967DA2